MRLFGFSYFTANGNEVRDVPDFRALLFLKSQITYILGTVWHSNRQNTNRTTKINTVRPGDEKREANCAGRGVASLRDGQEEMA